MNGCTRQTWPDLAIGDIGGGGLRPAERAAPPPGTHSGGPTPGDSHASGGPGETRDVPQNSGVFLTTQGSPVADKLRKLEEQGTEISSCITCLTYFDRMEKMIVGKRSDMTDTVSALTSFKKVVTP